MKKKSELQKCLLAASSLALIAVAGCDKPGPAETVGRNVDQSMEKMGQKVDKTMDQAGQKLDQATDAAKEQAARAGRAIDDTAITAAVKAGILAEPGLKVLKIDVDTKNGTVTLTGSADSPANVQKAAQIASNVEGVISVDNRLAVSSKG